MRLHLHSGVFAGQSLEVNSAQGKGPGLMSSYAIYNEIYLYFAFVLSNRLCVVYFWSRQAYSAGGLLTCRRLWWWCSKRGGDF
jgi:hypothetical protein